MFMYFVCDMNESSFFGSMFFFKKLAKNYQIMAFILEINFQEELDSGLYYLMTKKYARQLVNFPAEKY